MLTLRMSSLGNASSPVYRQVRRLLHWLGVPFLTLVVLVLILFKDVLFRDRIFYERDIHSVWFGQVETLVRFIASGAWPVWDPSLGFGQPFLANPSTQVLYPWTWLNVLVQPGTSYTFYVVSHFVLTAAGVYALGQRFGASRGGSLLSAAVWITSGPVLSLVSLWHHLAGAAWIPWVLLAADATFRSPRVQRALLWGATLAIQVLAGSADMCAMTALLVAAYALRYVRWPRLLDPSNLRLLALATVAVGFALVLSAGLSLPALDYAVRSGRWNLAEAMRTYWSVHPFNLLQVFLPVLSQDLPLKDWVRTLLFEGREPFLSSLYLGITALCLVATALSSRRPLTPFLAFVGIAGCLIALGRHTAAYEIATWLFPPLTILRYPSKAMVMAAFAWSLLAGLGFDEWKKPETRSKRRWVLLVIAPVIVASMTIWLGALLTGFQAETWAHRFLRQEPSLPPLSAMLAPTARRLALVAAFSTVAALLAFARTRRPDHASRWAIIVSVLAVLELYLVHAQLNATASRELFAKPPPILKAFTQEGPTRIFVFDYFLEVQGRVYRRPAPREIFTLPEDVLTRSLALQEYLSPFAARRWGLLGSYDFDALGLYPNYLYKLTLLFRAAEETPAYLRLLRMGAVQYVVSLHKEGFEELMPVAEVDGPFPRPIRVFRVPGAFPRAYVVGSTRTADDLEARRILVHPAFDPAREVVLTQGAALEGNSLFRGSTRILELRADRLRLEADLSDPGHLVVADGYDPGWRATVDGLETPVFRANIAFRAVRVPAGTHLVEFAYRPRTVMIGLATSIVALIIGLGVAIHSVAMSIRLRADC